MKPAPFVYHRPTDIDHALALLAEHAHSDGRILAGGQSLVPIMAFRLSRPAHVIDINNVAELAHIHHHDGTVSIGALVRHATFEGDTVSGTLGRLLRLVVHNIAHAPIRTRGTLCGSVAHADPASEWCLVAATLDAVMVARSSRGARDIQAADYFQGVMSTALRADELLAEVRLPVLPDDAHFGFVEFNRRAGDFAMAACLAVLRLRDGKVTEARIGIGGAEATPRRITAAEHVLLGTTPTSTTIDAAAEAAAADIDPLEDAQTDAAYRRDLVRAMVQRAVTQAMETAP
jgi:aerobic carbon-monoxide dehydrogenase medium subunit